MNERQKEIAEQIRVFFKNFLPEINYTVIVDDWLEDDKLVVTTEQDELRLMKILQTEFLKSKKRLRGKK